MKSFILGSICLFSILASGQGQIEISDFQTLNATSWVGELMYINYSDGKAVRLRTSMELHLDGRKLIMDIKFLDEPGANGADTIKISKDGHYLGKEKVIEKYTENSVLKISTRYKGKDNNKPAMIYKYYKLGDNTFEITKKVLYTDTKDSLIRNKYSYVKQMH